MRPSSVASKSAAGRWRGLLATAATIAFAGCTALVTPSPPRLEAAADLACAQWFESLDRVVDQAGVRDAENHRLPGWPALRVNRLLAAQAPAAGAADDAFAAWIERLRTLDEADRQIEIGNLPAAARAGIDASRLAPCSQRLARAAAKDSRSRAELLDRAHVPDRYSAALRTAGLYALLRWPFFAGVTAWQREHAEAVQNATAEARPARRHVPGDIGPGEAALPLEAQLLAAHAPVLDLEGDAGHDRFGVPAWADDARPVVDTSMPVVYQRLTHTLVGGRALVQLVYTLWFPERPASGALDLLAGHLDGVILRLTLSPEGRPWLLDTIHACGCWHQFFPAQGVMLRENAPAHEEWVFVPSTLPELAPGERFAVRLSAATHQVIAIGRAAASHGTPYARRSEDELRRLPLPASLGGGTRSLYGADGLVAGSERGERFLFWPMGIASAGAMRQWGHHATAFVGRRHFDDADLLERRFVFPARW